MTLKKFLRAGSVLGMGLIMMTSLVPTVTYARDDDRRTPQVRGSNMNRERPRSEAPRPQQRVTPAPSPRNETPRTQTPRTQTPRPTGNAQNGNTNRGPRQGATGRTETPRAGGNTDRGQRGSHQGRPQGEWGRNTANRPDANTPRQGQNGGNWQGRDRDGQRQRADNNRRNSYDAVRGAGSRGQNANRGRDRDREHSHNRGRDRDHNWNRHRDRDHRHHAGRHYVERHHWRPHGRSFRLNYRNYDSFYGYSGVRVGFYFAPGYGYYNVPTQYYNTRYRIGDYLPSFFFTYHISDPAYYDLPYLPFGTAYYFVGRDVALVDLATGVIIDIFYDVY